MGAIPPVEEKVNFVGGVFISSDEILARSDFAELFSKLERTLCKYWKLVSTIFYFDTKWYPFKNYGKCYFYPKNSFLLRYSIFCIFFLFLFMLSGFKRTSDSGIFYVMNWLAWVRCNFWNNSKTALYHIKFGQVKEFFWTCFVTWGVSSP